MVVGVFVNQSIKSQPEAQAQQIITFVNNLDHFLILDIRSTAWEGVNSVYTVHSSYLSKLFKNENDNTSESCSFASPSGKLSISKYRGHDHTTHSFFTGVQVLVKNKLIDVLDVSFYSKKSELKMLKYLFGALLSPFFWTQASFISLFQDKEIKNDGDA